MLEIDVSERWLVNEFGGLGYANFLSSSLKGRLMLIHGG
jgi:hypothetical protein